MNGMPLINAETVHLDKNTFMWVQITQFGDTADDDDSTLAAMIASPAYDDDFSTAFNLEHRLRQEQQPHAVPQSSTPPVHGRWWLSAIGVDSFRSTTAFDAEARIRSWADHQDWIDPTYRQPPEVHGRLERVYEVLKAGNIYTLVNPGDEAMHDFGFSTGRLGFHEFVVIDRRRQLVHVVVASDD